MDDIPSDTESRLVRIERLLESGGREVAPAWRRVTHGEPRWAVTAAILGAVALQLKLPEPLTLLPFGVLPGLEAVLLMGLVAANPRRVEPRNRRLRSLGLALIGLISLANGWAAAQLGQDADDAPVHGLPGDRGAGRGPRRQHPPLTVPATARRGGQVPVLPDERLSGLRPPAPPATGYPLPAVRRSGITSGAG
ncbi:hypothetical protein ACICHK_36780 [Streptomyces sp. AHU1]|uniref:hypothetical protein n=1 Tax=Streptomyces sp. AHU1 TaxID=3377215 RepID=UPI00387795D9